MEAAKGGDFPASSGPELPETDMKARVAAVWEKMNKGTSEQTLRFVCKKPSSTVNNTKRKTSTNWMNYLGLAPKKEESLSQEKPQERPNLVQNGSSDESKRLASAALSAVKEAAAAAASGRGKVEITEIRDFAGQEIEVKKLVDSDSKEASDKARAAAPSAVDAVLEQIKKKPKLSVLDKTKKDWGEFKEENQGMEDELDAYKKSSNQYLDRVSFLQRADYREFERERDVRLAIHARRKPDMRDEP
ncbi:craniofacial development protein 1 isoform X2 [Rhodamnia argentea]|nr:craniofacial development protein 1 isoform X2 [Rhodamnia argentea]